LSQKEKDEEIKRMVATWHKVKDELYQGGLARLDDTAKSLITLSSSLITVGFTVSAGLVGNKLLKASSPPLWFAFLGFLFFMLATISAVAVLFKRRFMIIQTSLPADISGEWERIQTLKNNWLKVAYIFFTIGVICEILAIFLLTALGA
jgi:hypothetical protein